MDYSVKTRVLLGTHFDTSEFNMLLFEGAKPDIIEDIRSVLAEDPTLSQYIHGDLTFRFSGYDVLLKYRFECNDENEAEAESFSESCVKDIQKKLEEKGYSIKRVACTAEEMDMKWLDELEDMIFPKSPQL